MGDIPPPPNVPKPSGGRWPLEWIEWVKHCKALGISARVAANHVGMTRSQITGQHHRLNFPATNPSVRKPYKERDPRQWDSGGWSEARLTEPWSQYTARRQAERQAKRNRSHA